jgi:hypothetical protein
VSVAAVFLTNPPTYPPPPPPPLPLLSLSRSLSLSLSLSLCVLFTVCTAVVRQRADSDSLLLHRFREVLDQNRNYRRYQPCQSPNRGRRRALRIFVGTGISGLHARVHPRSNAAFDTFFKAVRHSFFQGNQCWLEGMASSLLMESRLGRRGFSTWCADVDGTCNNLPLLTAFPTAFFINIVLTASCS